MKYIDLIGGRHAVIDDEDFDVVSKYKWRLHCTKIGTNWFYARTCIYTPIKNYKYIYLHRLVMNFPQKGIQVDHINGNKLDCRKANLRLATNAENSRNSVKPINNTSGYKGVWKRTDNLNRKKMWVANVIINKKKYSMGCFYTAKEAALAYDKKASELFGEFARLNFPKVN